MAYRESVAKLNKHMLSARRRRAKELQQQSVASLMRREVKFRSTAREQKKTSWKNKSIKKKKYNV